MIIWQPPLLKDRHGIITAYDISFKDEFKQIKYHKVVNGTTVFTLLNSLSPYTNYKITIRAATNAGYGPTSLNIDQRTLEGSM